MAEIKFEQALKKLEEIVAGLENGELNLDAALKKYEEGMKLISLCSKKLEAARKKVEVLTRSEDGALKPKPFTGEE